MIADYMHTGHEETLECALTWLDRWASAGALEDPTSDHSGKSVRKWALASLASSWLRLKFSASHPLDSARDAPVGRVGRIDRWLGSLARLTVNDWSGQPLVKINNHEYWAAWAVMATGVALNRRDYFDWAVGMYKTAAKQVDEDGYLPNELARDTRALMYHNYALEPLAMIAAFAKANGVDLTGEGNGAIPRLAERVLEGVDDPQLFEQKTGRKQMVDELRESSKFAWLEPYCWTYGCDSDVARRVNKLRPMKTYRLGGDVTELFYKRSAS
jgi:poly(beta-D-mannuronate) lyase